MRVHRSFSLVLFLCLCSASTATCWGQTLIDLGTLSGGSGGDSYGTAINELGDVVGGSEASNGFHGFLYTGGIMYNLGSCGSTGVPSEAFGINSDGEIVGWSMVFEYPDEDYAMIHMQNGTSMTNIWALGWMCYYAKAFAVNEVGLTVGESATTGVSAIHAFYYDGTMHDMGTLGGIASTAAAVNNYSKITGTSDAWVGGVLRNRAFLYTGGTMTDLGARVGGSHSYGYGINDYDQVAGSVDDNNGKTQAYIFTSTTTGLSLGTFTGGTNARANDINNYDHANSGYGEVVGQSNGGFAGGYQHAFYWNGGSLVDLSTTYGTPAGWTVLFNAVAINDNGWIVGTGIKGGKNRAFLLKMRNY